MNRQSINKLREADKRQDRLRQDLIRYTHQLKGYLRNKLSGNAEDDAEIQENFDEFGGEIENARSQISDDQADELLKYSKFTCF